MVGDPSLRCPHGAWDTTFARLFATNPEAAQEAFGRLSQTSQTSQNASALAFGRQWAEVSPEEALRWAEGIKGNAALQAALTVVARSHPLEALRKMPSPGKALSEVIRSALSELDPETLMKACGTVRDNRFLIQGAMNAVLEKEFAADPRKAFALLDLVRADSRSSSIQFLATNCPLDRASEFLPGFSPKPSGITISQNWAWKWHRK